MTSPESPAVQDTDRLREVAEVAAWQHYERRIASVAKTERAFHASWQATCVCGWESAPMDDRDAADAEHSAHLAAELSAAVLPVRRAQVLREMADELRRRAPRFGEAFRAGGIRYSAAVLLAAAREPAVSAPPTPPGSPPADERATAVETGRGGVCCASAAESDGHCHQSGCLYLLGLQTGRAERDRLARELETMTEVARSNKRHVGYIAEQLEERDALLHRAFVAEDKLDLALVNRAEVIEARNRLAETNARLQVERDDALALVASCTTTQQRRLVEAIRRYEPVIKEARNILNRVAETEAVQTADPYLAEDVADLAQRLAALGDIPSPTAPEAGE